MNRSPGNNTYFEALYEHLRLLLRRGFPVFVLLLLGGGVWYLLGKPYKPGHTRENLSAYLSSRFGLTVASSELLVPRGVPTTSSLWVPTRDLVFLGRRGGGHRDVYWARVTLSNKGIPLGGGDPVNLTFTPRVDERLLVSKGGRVAFFSPGRGVTVLQVSASPFTSGVWEGLRYLESRLTDGQDLELTLLTLPVTYRRVALRWKGEWLHVAPPKEEGAPFSFNPVTRETTAKVRLLVRREELGRGYVSRLRKRLAKLHPILAGW